MQLKQLELAGGGTLTVYLRDCCERMPNVLDRPLVLVVPGGGYTHVSAREGDPVALQFAAAGYHTAVLDYAICEKAKDYMPLRQLAEAIGLVRQHAAQWHILPEKIAVCGFSAGGHLALSGAVLDIPGEAAQPELSFSVEIYLYFFSLGAGIFVFCQDFTYYILRVILRRYVFTHYV